MTIMQFDSHRGWYNPERTFRPVSLGCGASRVSSPDPRRAPIAERDFFVLLEQARAGDTAAQTELRNRGNNTSR